ncbi:hypothetical protein ACROYT_G020455 [Oculina patagonica]
MTTQNQPQKKIKILQLLRAIQAEQLSKLQQKHQLEQDLLEDVRTYTKQRSTIEREYAQALQKLNSQFLQKKELSAEEITGENGHKTPHGVWKSLLDESEKKAKQRMAISEELQGQMAESMKTLKSNKAQVFKKCQELTQKIHEELFETARELSKAKKGYEEMEKLAQVAREQAADAEDKLKKKNVKFFQSKTSLEKNLNKSSSRREICERRTAMARNDYILSLATANAHMTRYFCKELQDIMSTLDGDFFDQLRGYFTTLGQVEVDACKNAMPGFETVVSHANTINRDVSLQSFLAKNKVFSEVVQYEFESCRHDKVRTLTTEHNAGLALNKEARKLAMRLAKDQMSLKAKIKQLQAVKNTDDAASAASDGNQEGEQSADTLKESIRLIETSKLKTEACLEVMREAGVNVDEWMKSANSLSPNDMEADFHGSENSLNSFNDDFIDDDWDDMDDTFTADYSSDEDAKSVSSNCSIPVACVALYNFDATDSEELTIAEGEELEIIERDGEGWCKGRNKSGQVGFFPESYVEVGPTASHSPPQITPGSSYTDGPIGGSPVSVASIGQATSASTKYLCYVRALYDYEAMGDDEISFKEGDIVGVIQTDDNNVDDGFWYGEFQGRRGVFPSLVVEDLPEGFQTTDTNMNVTDSLPSTSSSNTRAGDYITLPLDYKASASAPAASNMLQPVRKAPPPPADSPKIPRSTTMASGGARALLPPTDRQRAKTENSTTMKKPDSGAFSRSMSQNPSLQLKMYENINQLVPSSRPPDYVNVSDLPSSSANGPSTSGSTSLSAPKPVARSRRPAPPPKPPPPTAASKNSFTGNRSISYV